MPPVESSDLYSFTVVFRSALSLMSGAADSDPLRETPTYQATPETIQQIASDFAALKATGVYPVVQRSQARTLALRFEDVLYIG